MNGSKFAVYVSDNDWKRYHVWTESAAVHGYLALTESSPMSSALEEAGHQAGSFLLARISRELQLRESLRVREGVDAADCRHRAAPPAVAASAEPLPAAEVDAQLQGAHQKHDVNLLTPLLQSGKLSQRSTGDRAPRSGTSRPRTNAWMLLPSTANYGMAIDGKPGPDAGAKVFTRKGAEWFWGLRRHVRGEQEAFVSLPDEIVVMMSAVPRTALTGRRKTG